MKLNHLEYWPFALIAFVIFLSLTVMYERKFFRMIKTYWFFNRSILSYLSSFLFLTGIGLLLFAVLDIRGPEEKIESSVPTDRTIILVDTSASMLAEDVKPSRLQKAALIAKHFARRAAGHQISIVAFAEIQKKIIPFTNDLDLIDARLDSLKSLRNQYGSSALTTALQESIQYFRETGDSVEGNILVLTDGEETAEALDLKIPKEVRVAFVGIGTNQGGRIPMDDSRGFRFGYKKDRGQDIITKLNENFFKSAVSDIPTAKYWLANSYALPSEEILDFFISEKTKGLEKQDMVIRPVLMEWAVVPAILLIIFSYLFKAVRIFTLGLLLLIGPGWAQDQEKEPELTPEIIERLSQLQKGKLDQIERLKLADDLYKAGAKPEALTLYEENLNTKKVDKSLPPEAYLNYGTGLLESGETGAGLHTYEKLMDSLAKNPEKSKEIKEMIEKNIVTHFMQQEQKKEQQQKKDKEDQQKGENKDKQGQGQGSDKQSSSGEGQDKNQQGQPQSGQDQKNQEQKDKEQQAKEKAEKDKKEKEKKDGEGEDQDKDKDNKEKKDDQGKEGEDGDDKKEQKKLPPMKLPAKLKQLMSDDRQLQMKIIENGTRDLNKRKSRRSKDW
ncbi:MAG TPA: VWA domain-containing protein [Bacteriovoracaceae bacterium]|nr:VWA domain-containing protein [Bacteriovoracaceae bacterium]